MFARRVIAIAALVACALALVTLRPAVGAKPKYTGVALLEDGFGGHARRVYPAQTDHWFVVGDTGAAGGKYVPTLWSFSPAEMFAEIYASLAPGQGGTIQAAAFNQSIANGVLVGTAQDGGGTDNAVLWRGGLPEAEPVSLLPFVEQSAAVDVISLPSPGDEARYGVVGSMTLEGGATRGFYALPEVGDEVLVLFIGQLPTLGGENCEATGLAKISSGVRIVGRAQDAQGTWRPCKWEGPDFDAIINRRDVRTQANAVEFGLITALQAPGAGTVHDISPSAEFAAGSTVNANGVAVPIAWQANPQGAFAPHPVTVPRRLIEGAAVSVDDAGHVVAYHVVRRKGKTKLSAFVAQPHLSARVIDVSGKFLGVADFTNRRPTGLAAGGVICGFGPRNGFGETVFPFLLLPP